jgi:uncharacterized Zn finger protein
MSMKTKLTAFIFLILSFSAFAESEVKAIVLKDNTVIQSEDIYSISFDENSSNIISIELNDETPIDSSDVKTIILKRTQNLKSFQRGFEGSSRAVVGNGNGSGG